MQENEINMIEDNHENIFPAYQFQFSSSVLDYQSMKIWSFISMNKNEEGFRVR